MSKLDLKTLLFSGALALGAQNVLATSPLPCPKDSPINDQIGVLKTDIKDKIKNRLITLDREKLHQVTIITINSLEEYGYDSFSSLGADTINKCGIGYRGKNTGVIVWYGKQTKPAYFISTSSGVSGYITDADTQKLGRHSLDGCNKNDTSCRVDDITKGLENIINNQFKNKEQVKIIKDEVKNFDDKKTSQDIDILLNFLGLAGGVFLFVGGGYKLNQKIKVSSARKKLRKKFLNLQIQLGLEKTKYPDWFIKSHIIGYETKLNEYLNYSDEEVDSILKSLSKTNRINMSLSEIENKLKTIKDEFEEISENVGKKRKKVEDEIKRITDNYKKLESEKFIFKKEELKLPEVGKNPEETIRRYDNYLYTLMNISSELEKIPKIYKSAEGFDKRGIEDFNNFSGKYKKILEKYETIFGKYETKFSISELEKSVLSLIENFKTEYNKKDISKLSKIMEIYSSIFHDLKNNINELEAKVSWYEGLPNEIKNFEDKLSKFKYSPEYDKNAKSYKQESGKRNFDNYDMKTKLGNLMGLLAGIKENYSSRKGLNTLSSTISTLNSEINLMTEYVGLGAVVTTLVANRIAEEAERARRAQEEADRLRRQQEEDDNRRRSEDNNRSTTPDWSPGGGDGGDGGGDGFD